MLLELGGTSNTAALAFGGYAQGQQVVIHRLHRKQKNWNGSSWTEVNDLNTPRSYLTGGGTSSTAAIACGGYRGPPTTDRTKCRTMEWNILDRNCRFKYS